MGGLITPSIVLIIGNPNAAIDSSTAGVINGVADIMRQMQFGGTLTF